jgi:hypothetical protein
MARGRGRLSERMTWCDYCRKKYPAKSLKVTAKGLLCESCYKEYQNYREWKYGNKSPL